MFDKLLSKYRLVERGIYSVERGEHTGCFFIYIKKENILKSLAFLVTPHPMGVIYLSHPDVKQSLRDGDLKFLQRLPKPVYEVCEANFIHYKKKTKA